MENRSLVTKDYFKLRILLNRTNKRSNEKTNIRFLIQKSEFKWRFVATLDQKGSSIIELCSYGSENSWDESGFSGLQALENFCCTNLDKYQKIMGINDMRLSSESKVSDLVTKITDKLRDLLISEQTS